MSYFSVVLFSCIKLIVRIRKTSQNVLVLVKRVALIRLFEVGSVVRTSDSSGP